MQTWLATFLVWGLYPVWLLAGAADYLCHRLTNIERTSGATEAWLHLAQFACLAIALTCAVLLRINAAVFGVMAGFVVAHSILSYVDVAYTSGRRRIHPIEQAVHGFMDVLPLVAVALIGVQYWTDIRTAPVEAGLRGPVGAGQILFLSSFLLLAGLPIFEELLRTLRSDSNA